ncbi:outer membrane lipoprotein carrier protein LolA [Hyphobacterium sp. CCMP332]|nr:outer membrane lipoprotein carrier protein LolA [Hyphobacterium sp. CCMP332]
MKRLIVACAIMGMAIASHGQYDKKAKEYLDKVSEKFQKINAFKASFTYSMESPANDVSDSFSGEIMVKGDDKIKLDLRDQIIFIDGTTQWNYLPEDKEVNIVEYDAEEMEFSPDKIYNLYKTGYKYIYIEPITEKGKTYHVIDLVPEDRNKSFFKIKLFIEDKTSNIASWRIYEKSGNKYQYKITSFEENVKLSDSEFKFDKTKYKGVEEIDLR